jgi:hypothetical protein
LGQQFGHLIGKIEFLSLAIPLLGIRLDRLATKVGGWLAFLLH